MSSHPGIGAGRGFRQRKSPTGGNAYGRDLVNDDDHGNGDDHDDDEYDDIEAENASVEEPESGVGKAISACQHLTHCPPLGKNHFLVMNMIIIIIVAIIMIMMMKNQHFFQPKI